MALGLRDPWGTGQLGLPAGRVKALCGRVYPPGHPVAPRKGTAGSCQ